MRYTVPQFIEHEAKIIGPFTFKQFLYLAGTACACFIAYLSVSFSIFLIITIFLVAIATSFAFLKINGRSFPTILWNFFIFKLSPKMYIWHKKDATGIEFKKEIIKKEETDEDKLPLRIAGQGQLKKLNNETELNIKIK